MAEMGSSRQVVVVEDNTEAREMLVELVIDLGHAADGCADGKAGVTRLCVADTQIGLIDLTLPDMDGFEVARQIRASRTDHPTLIALTGHSLTDELWSRAKAAGFDQYMTKPIDLNELIKLLEA